MNKAVGPGFLSVAATLLLANPAGAQSIEGARAAYAEGHFIEAAELGESLGTSEGYALAAESLAIHGYYIAADTEQPELFASAIRAAEEAIRLDPGNPEAHFQSAHAIGREAQTVGVMEALNRGYARRTREAAQEALRLDPEMATRRRLNWRPTKKRSTWSTRTVCCCWAETGTGSRLGNCSRAGWRSRPGMHTTASFMT